MQIKMYHDNDLFVCRFGSYKDQGGDYFVECEHIPSDNSWSFFKCYDNDTVEATQDDVSPEMQVYIQRLMLNTMGQQVKLRDQKDIRMLGLKGDNGQEVLYAIDNNWLMHTFKDFDEGENKCETIIARAMLEKKVAFMYQPAIGHPFVFVESASCEKSYVAFADVISQILRQTGHEDAAVVIDKLLDIQPA